MDLIKFSPFSLVSSWNLVLPTILLFLFFVFKQVVVLDGRKNKKLLPGPLNLPVIGSLLNVAGRLPHHALKDLATKHGPLMHVKLGEISTVVVSSRRLARELIKTHDLVVSTRPTLVATEIFAYNNSDIVFAPYGEYWRQMRKIATLELLSAKKVRSFRSIREDEVWNLIESIRSSSSTGSPLNLTKKIFSLTNGIVCRAAFGNRCEYQDSLIKSVKEVMSLTGGFDLADLFPSFKLLHRIINATGMMPNLQKLYQKVDQIFDSIINERIEHKKGDTGGDTARDQEDLLDVLLRLKESSDLQFPITYNNIKAVIMDMFSAGADTSSATIEWAIAEMLRNPRVMAKAQEELRQALIGKQVIHESDIKEYLGAGTSYLNLVIKETLRLHPPGALLPRECREECVIDGYTIPIGTRIVTNAWALGRDPEYWKDPESFYPERFENSSVDFMGSSYEFLPFGGGRRMCPGMNFGLANVELPLAQLLYHFDWKLPSGMNPGDIDMRETSGITVTKTTPLFLIANPAN